jgi:hypothetical protein
VYDDGRRYFATHTYDNRTHAEGWLANERKLIELGEWSPPDGRAALKVLAGVTLREYAEQWVKHRDLTPKTHALYTRLLNSRILPELGAVCCRSGGDHLPSRPARPGARRRPARHLRQLPARGLT